MSILLHNRTVLRLLMGSVVFVGLNALADETALLGEARQVASAVPPKLLQVLNEEISKNGPASAVNVCHDKAPQMAKAASEKTGWTIRRVSLRNRNPKAVPDAWERATLQEFDSRAAAGEDPAKLEKFTLVDNAGRKEFRYMKALPVQPVCLACHGAADAIAPNVATQIRTLYPNDQGTGYSLGQIRGAMTIRKAL